MIEKIEITQRFNFKKLNRHYECYTIDFLNRSGYYQISERGSGDKFVDESTLCDDTWVDILVDLRHNMTSEIHTFASDDLDDFLDEFMNLNLFEDFESEKFSYFEKLEVLYSCIVIIYSSDGYKEYSFKNNFPEKWNSFGAILKKLTGVDILHLNYQHQFANPLYHEIKRDGVYSNGEKLALKTIEFGHYRCLPYDIPHPRVMVNFKDRSIHGYLDKDLSSSDEEKILELLEKYHVYLWIFDEYHSKSNRYDPEDLEGYDWYLEMVFEGNVIWHLFGYNDYPDTYLFLAREIIELTDMDLLEIDTISSEDINLFEKYGNAKLS